MNQQCSNCGQALDPTRKWEENNHPEIQTVHSLERCFANVKRQRNESYRRFKLESEAHSNSKTLLIQQTFKLQELMDENNRLFNSLTVMRNLLNRFYGIVSTKQGDLARILSLVHDVLNGDTLTKEEFEDIIKYSPSKFEEKDGE